MISIVSCCHSAKLCADTARDFAQIPLGISDRNSVICKIKLVTKHYVDMLYHNLIKFRV